MQGNHPDFITAEELSKSAGIFAFLALTGVLVASLDLPVSALDGEPFRQLALASLISYLISGGCGYAVVTWLHYRGRRLAFVDVEFGVLWRLLLRIPSKRPLHRRKLTRLPGGIQALYALQHIAFMAGIVTLGMMRHHRPDSP